MSILITNAIAATAGLGIGWMWERVGRRRGWHWGLSLSATILTIDLYAGFVLAVCWLACR